MEGVRRLCQYDGGVKEIYQAPFIVTTGLLRYSLPPSQAQLPPAKYGIYSRSTHYSVICLHASLHLYSGSRTITQPKVQFNLINPVLVETKEGTGRSMAMPAVHPDKNERTGACCVACTTHNERCLIEREDSM